MDLPETMLTVTSLSIYPIKSCAGIAVDRLDFDDVGPVNDRRYMVIRSDGRFLTQRQIPLMARITPVLTETGLTLTVSGQPEAGSCDVIQPSHQDWRECQIWGDQTRGLDCGEAVAEWLEKVLGQAVRLVYMPNQVVRSVDPDYADVDDRVGFADGFPILLTHQVSLDFLSEQLGRPLEMGRFRPNIVVDGGTEFGELQWKILKSEHTDAAMHLVKPCTRCVIPLRNLQTLERETDVMTVLKEHCRIGKEIIFGQNTLLRTMNSVELGSRWLVLP